MIDVKTFRFSVRDNGQFAFHKRSDLKRCWKCGELLDKWNEPLPGFTVRSLKGLDFSTTYDSLKIASRRFKECYDSHRMVGLSFTPLAGRQLSFKVGEIIVPVDFVKRGTRFLKRCDVCGRYEEVIGATPVYLKDGASVPDNGFARTDLEFGTGDRKGPVFLCGSGAAAAFGAANLRGVDLLPA
jgi:hypothetical protein